MQGRLTVATPQYLRMFASAEKSMGHWAAALRNWVQHPTSTHQPTKPEVLWEGSLWPLVWWKDNETAWKKLSPIEGFDSVVCFSPRQSDVLVVRPKSKLQLERFWLVRLVGLLLRYLMQRSFMPLSHDLESSAWDLSHQRLPTGTVGLSSISASAPRLFASLCASLYSHGSQGRRMKHDDQPLVAVKSCHEWSMFFFQPWALKRIVVVLLKWMICFWALYSYYIISHHLTSSEDHEITNNLCRSTVKHGNFPFWCIF